MKSLKYELFEFAQNLNQKQPEIAKIVTEHYDLCDEYSEREITVSLKNTLEIYKYFENVTSFLNEIDTELSSNPLLYTLKDLYAKIARKEYRFLYENALHLILECINQLTDYDRKLKIVTEMNIYEWIPEVKLFLFEMASTPQAKQNFVNEGGRVEDVYSIVLQLKEGYMTYVHDTWFLMNDDGIKATLAENHVQDEVQLKKLRLLEDVMRHASLTNERITFKVADDLKISIDTKNQKLYLNESETEQGSTLETLFNSPVVPFMAKAFYPLINEAYNNVKLFMQIDAVKKVSNVVNTAYECYVFNYKKHFYQYRLNKYEGNTYWSYDNAMSIIENIIHELGADLTFFYENELSEELITKIDLEKKEKVLTEKLSDIENGILKIKEESNDIKENKTIKILYNNLLSKKHKISEELKHIRNEKIKVLNK